MRSDQTALDYFFSELSRCEYFIGSEIIHAYNEAKEMEKDQIIEAFDNGIDHYLDIEKPMWGRDYYKETYER
jgi:hypothetical protein